jgi:hypothetical protein
VIDDTAKIAIESSMAQVKRSLESNVDALKHDLRMAQIIETHRALNTLEGLLGRPKTSLAQVFGLEQEEKRDDKTVIRTDEFFGYKPLDAAKLFLRKKGQACSLSEIAAGIRSGGGIVESEEDLGKALSRSTYQIAKIGDSYGLLEFYPHIQRGRGKKKRAAEEEEETSQPIDEQTGFPADERADSSSELDGAFDEPGESKDEPQNDEQQPQTVT